MIAGWNRPIKDDIGDHAHGTLDIREALAKTRDGADALVPDAEVGPQRIEEADSAFAAGAVLAAFERRQAAVRPFLAGSLALLACTLGISLVHRGRFGHTVCLTRYSKLLHRLLIDIGRTCSPPHARRRSYPSGSEMMDITNTDHRGHGYVSAFVRR